MTIDILSTFARKNDGDFPLLVNTDVEGGWMTVVDNIARDAIKANIRAEGMHVWSVGAATLYRLAADLVTWTAVPLGAAVGSPVSGATANRVLFIDGAGNLADSVELGFAGTRLTIGNPTTPEGVLDVDGDITARRNVQPTTALDGFWYCGAPGRRWYSVWTYGMRFDGPTSPGNTGFLSLNNGDTLRFNISGSTIFTAYGGYYSGYALANWYSRWNNVPSGNSGGAFPAIRTFQTSDSGIAASAPQFLFSRVGTGITFSNGATIATQGMLGIGKVGTAFGNRLAVRSAGTTQIDALSTLYIDNAPEVTLGIVTTGTVNTFGLYALHVDAGVARFDGDGTYVFELPADATDPTGGGGAAEGQIPVYIFGVGLKHLAYYA